MTAEVNNTGAAPSKRDRADTIRTGLGADAIAAALLDNLHYLQAKSARTTWQKRSLISPLNVWLGRIWATS